MFTCDQSAKVEALKNFEQICFGNTGVSIYFNSCWSKWELMYLPDNNDHRISEKIQEYTLRFTMGLDLLLEWVFKKLSLFDPDLPEPLEVVGRTNFNMDRDWKILFSSLNSFVDMPIYESEMYRESHTNQEQYIFSINITELIEALFVIQSLFREGIMSEEELHSILFFWRMDLCKFRYGYVPKIIKEMDQEIPVLN